LLDSNFNEADQSSFKAILNLLSIPLDAYKQKAVIKLIKDKDDNIEKLLSVREQSSIVIESDIKSEADASTQPCYAMLGDVTLGCNAYQGYLFCQPLPLSDFEAKLDQISSMSFEAIQSDAC
jgi:hypothetical protein